MLEIAEAAVAVHAVGMVDIPDPQVAPRAVARTFPVSYKARILSEYDGLPKSERASLLRREGLYSTLISKWRRQAARDAADPSADPSADRRPGPRPADPSTKEVARLTAQVERLTGELAESRRINDVQAKLFALLGELSKSAAPQERQEN